MKNLLIAGVSAIALLSAGMASAGSPGINSGANAAAGAIANPTSTSGAIAGAQGGHAQGVGQQGQSQGVQIVGDHVESYSKSEAQPAIAPNLAGLYASPHTCMGSSTASVGINGVFSAGVGSTYQDDECNKREAVKLAAQLGLKQAAAAVFYDIEVVKEVIGVAENADLRAQQEAAQLAGIKMSARAPKTAEAQKTEQNFAAKSEPDYAAWRGERD